MRITAKILQALGLASTMLALVQGLYGDEWGELYMFLAGIALFFSGRLIERRLRKRAAAQKG